MAISLRESLRARLVATLDKARKNPLPNHDRGAVWTTIEQGADVILDETERMIDGVIERVVKGEALRPVVRAALRSDLISWPTPWVRLWKDDWFDDEDWRDHNDIAEITDDARLRQLDRWNKERATRDRTSRAPHPALDALDVVVGDLIAAQRLDEWRALFAKHPDLADHPVLPERFSLDRTHVANLAWLSIGDEGQRLASLQTAVALADLNLNNVNGPFGDVDNLGMYGVVAIDGVGPVYLATAALVAHIYSQELTPERLARHAARVFLGEITDDVARHSEASTALARAIEDRLPQAPKANTLDDIGDDIDGVFPLDEALAAFLSSWPTGGQHDRVRKGSRERSRAENAARWGPHADPLRVPRLLASVLWHDFVRLRLAGKRIAAAPLVILRDLVTTPDVLRLEDDGSIWTPRGRAFLQTPSFGVTAARIAVHNGLDVPAFWKLLGYLLLRQRQRYLDTGNAKEASVIDVGTLTQLTAALGMSRGAEKDVRDGLAAGQNIGGARVGESWGGLWTVGGSLEPRARGGIRISLGPVLHIDAANYMPKTAKLLAPVADPARMPKTVGDHRTYARQHAADQELLCIATERSRQGTLDAGGFVFPFDVDVDRKAIGDAAGLYRRSHADLSTKWLDRFIAPTVSEMPHPVGRNPVIERADNKHLRIVDEGMRDFLASMGKRRERKSQKRREDIANQDKPKKRSRKP